MTAAPPDPPPAPPADPAAPLEKRVGAIEAKQDGLEGKVDKVIEMLTGRDAPVTGADAPPAAPDITEQVRQAVRDVNAETAAAQPKAPPAELTPREVTVSGKDRLQRALFGKDPKK